MRLVAALVFIGILVGAGTASAGERNCLPPRPDQKKVTYCESVWVGRKPVDTNRLEYRVSFESKFFDGLTRSRTKQGDAFRKGHHPVTNYPDSFVITVELFSLTRPADAVPGTPTRPPRDQKPRELVLRWLNQAGAVLNETKLPLEEVVEAWPEHRIPKVWYRATAGHVNERLDAVAELVIVGEGESLLATVRGRL